MNIFGKTTKTTRILIVGDTGPAMEKLRNRITVFWPSDMPVKTTPVYCAWAEEAIEAIKEYQPDILLLNDVFRRDDKTGRDVARWIDQHYHSPIRVAAYSDRPEAELRQLFSRAKCVKYFISGDRVRDFVDDCLRKEDAARD